MVGAAPSHRAQEEGRWRGREGGGSCQPGRLLFAPRTSVSYFWQLQKKKKKEREKLIRGKLNVFLPILGEKDFLENKCI